MDGTRVLPEGKTDEDFVGTKGRWQCYRPLEGSLFYKKVSVTCHSAHADERMGVFLLLRLTGGRDAFSVFARLFHGWVGGQ